MPELPEVEHVVRALRRVVAGRSIVAAEIRLPKLIGTMRPSTFSRKIKHTTITGVSRRGKFILIACRKRARQRGQHTGPLEKQANLVLLVHLRMTGKFLYLTADDEVPKHSHAIFYLDNDRRLVFRDQRQFGIMRLLPAAQLAETKGIAELAPEPFAEEFSTEYLARVLKRSRRTLKTLLLDQTRVLGLGNIYAVEALFRAGISPLTIASTLSKRRTEHLHAAIQDVLKFAVENIRGSKTLEEGFSYGAAFERFWQVYDREGQPCVRCGTRIRRVTHGGRSTYWCPRCQRN